MASDSTAARIVFHAAGRSIPRVGDLGQARGTREEVAPGHCCPAQLRTSRQPIEDGWIGGLKDEDRLVIGEKYLVALEADVLGVERRTFFEQHPDGVTHPGFERDNDHRSASLYCRHDDSFPAFDVLRIPPSPET